MSTTRRVLGALFLIGIGLLASAPAAAATPASAELVTVIVRLQPGGDVDAQVQRASAEGAQAGFRYRTALRGFSARVPARAVDVLRRLPQVVSVELDTPVRATEVQSPAEWGLDRIDQRALPLSTSYSYPGSGSGVTAYVIDTGILAGHTEFGGRVRAGYSAINDGRAAAADCDGHGTHVAGTLGGRDYGVAKGVALVPVRVLDCRGSGSTSQVIAGLDWVAADHAAGTPAVANLSLGGSTSSSLDAAVRAVISDGVTVSLTAGNEDENACNGSPSRVREAITVAASDRGDSRPDYSNVGDCVDLFAPGEKVRSAGVSSPTATAVKSGTSMAAPHVAGAAALLLSRNGALSPAAVADRLLTAATPNVISDPGSGTPNRLLYIEQGDPGTPTPPPTTPPTTPPACSGATPGPVNPGFEQGTAGWTASPGVIGQFGNSARTGSWHARLGGRGTSATTTLQQTITLPAGCRTYQLAFWLRVDTAETTRVLRNDTLTVTLGSATLAQYSNIDRTGRYVQLRFDVTGQAGRSVPLRWQAIENRSRATTFAVDDVTLTGSP